MLFIAPFVPFVYQILHENYLSTYEINTLQHGKCIVLVDSYRKTHSFAVLTSSFFFIILLSSWTLHPHILHQVIFMLKDFAIKKSFICSSFLVIIYKKNRFHFAVRLFRNTSQKTSNCGKNIRNTLDNPVCHVIVFTTFDVICDLLNWRTATWNLCVKLKHDFNQSERVFS